MLFYKVSYQCLMALSLYNQFIITSHKYFDIKCDIILPLRRYNRFSYMMYLTWWASNYMGNMMFHAMLHTDKIGMVTAK